MIERDFRLLRAFLAIELPGTIQKKIEEVQKDLKLSLADVRWVAPENIHLTLKFFGNIEESDIEPILESIGKPARKTLPFSLKVGGIGGFPNLKNPRVIWMGLEDRMGILVNFQGQLEKESEKTGFQSEERSFHPHLTLGRMKSNRGRSELVGRMERLKEEVFGDFQVEKVVLFKSDLTPVGPIYTPLREVRLGG